MATVLITGATGFVGSNIAEVLQQRGHTVFGALRRVPESELPWEYRVIDFSNVDSIASAISDTGASAVVHCAIANDFNMLMNDRVAAYDAYVGMTSRVTRAAEQNGAQTIYISTDWVHDGTGHLVAEDLPPNPLNIYGILKALGEQVVRDLASDGAICRIGGVMGQHRLQEMGPRSQDVGFGYFVASIVQALSKGDRFAVWGGENVNEVATPSLASEIGAGVGRIIEHRASGMFNLVCDDAVTRMELAKRTCAAFGLDESLLYESEVPAHGVFPALVPVDTSMSTTKTRSVLGLAPTSIDDILQAFRRELETGKVSPVTKD
jgi:dTDP-4-dehydrorhamnose reductase